MLLPAALPAPARGGFTTRFGGVSSAPYSGLDLALHVGDDPADVAVNRARLAEAVGVLPGALVFAEQVHGCGVAVVEAAQATAVPAVDALVTAAPGLALVVLAADCLPVLLADPAAGVVAVAHAGRRGLVAGVLPATVAAMAALGATPAGLTAVVGPAVCGRCYEVPAAMADEAAVVVPASRAVTVRGTASLDLAAGASAQLRAAGITRVRTVGGCTMEQDHFYSYRREGRTGRHAGVVVLASPA